MTNTLMVLPVTHLTPDAVPGIRLRPFQGEGDMAAIARIISLSNKADLIEEVVEPDEVANDLAHAEGFDLHADQVLAEAQEQPVGYSRMFRRVNAEGQRIYWQIGFIQPEWRRKGIGAAMLRFTESRAREHARAHPHPGPSFLQGVGEDTAYGKIAMFEQAGYEVARYFFFMQRPSLTDLPSAPLPPGLEIRPAQPEHMRLIWDTKEAAFRDHWGFAEKSEADYERWLHHPDHDPSLWQIVWDTQRGLIAGISLNSIIERDNAAYGFKRGLIDTVGVRREYRRRGLARALLVSSMQRLRERGMTEAVLSVDAENLTGALKIYQGVGFKVLNQDALYRKPLNP